MNLDPRTSCPDTVVAPNGNLWSVEWSSYQSGTVYTVLRAEMAFGSVHQMGTYDSRTEADAALADGIAELDAEQ